ncbi:MAG TPA: hypothetical protein VK502_03245 [Candidatus Saccharimonadales bacterium]|nr:hypothetical protein [Candidatus Saccharimonadales bacterium]
MASYDQIPTRSHEEVRTTTDEAALKFGSAVLEKVGTVEILNDYTEKSSSEISYKFNFSLHSEENAPEIAASLFDCDIIAIESTGDTTERRKQREVVFTQSLSDAVPRDILEQVSAVLAKGGEGFTGKLLENLAGSNKKVVLIDMSADEPDAHVLDEMDKADEALFKGIAENLSNDTLKTRLVESMKATAHASMKREELVVRQLTAMQDIDEIGGKKIGVVMGAVHTPVYHDLSKVFSVEREFTDARDSSSSARASYGHTAQMMRQLRLTPEKELDESLVNRTLVEEMYYAFKFYSSEDISEVHDGDHRARKIQKEITDKMSDEGVEAFLTELDLIKLNGSRGVFGKRKPVSTEQVYQFLLEQQRQYEDVA